MAFEILIVDDESDICNLIGEILTDEGFSCRYAYNSQSALMAVKKRKPNLILLDIWLGEKDCDGIKILEIVKKNHTDLPVIMMSGHGNITTAVDAIKKGAYDFIEKPFQTEKLLVLIERTLESYKLQIENKNLKNIQVSNDYFLQGKHSNICEMRTLLDKASPTNSRIIIQGEKGVGKSEIAKIIHQKSLRNNQVFNTINCSFIPPDKILALLLGTEKYNHYTPGLLEQSNKGTLYIADIDELPLLAQQKILKALQSNTFLRVNGQEYVETDVRIISSTTMDLEQLVQEGKFLSDLYYRLKVIILKIPALRTRVSDIKELVLFLNNAIANSLTVKSLTFSKDTLLTLEQYKWPGNIRQFYNTIEALLINQQDCNNIIKTNDLPNALFNNPAVDNQNSLNVAVNLSLKDARILFEKEYLLAQLDRFNGNISKVANFIGMERSALHRKLKSMDIRE